MKKRMIASLVLCLLSTQLSAAQELSNPEWHMPPLQAKKHNRFTLSKKATPVLAALRLCCYSYHILKHPDNDMSKAYALGWGAVDLSTLVESIVKRDNTSLDDSFSLTPEEQITLTTHTNNLKNIVLPVVITALPILSACFSESDNHDYHRIAYKIQSITSVIRLAASYLDCPKSIEKRLYGGLLVIHAMRTLYDILELNTLEKKAPVTTETESPHVEKNASEKRQTRVGGSHGQANGSPVPPVSIEEHVESPVQPNISVQPSNENNPTAVRRQRAARHNTQPAPHIRIEFDRYLSEEEFETLKDILVRN